ncbi:MAG: SlyX family protein [Pseudomonadota bacterium]
MQAPDQPSSIPSESQAAQIDELEMKSAFQEQLIQDLNQALIDQGERIVSLEKQLQRLIDYLQSQETPTASPADLHEPPPHY